MIPEQDNCPLPTQEDLANILGNYLELVKNHSNELSWLLEQHANLRSEYITFFKKDLKEIEVALDSLIKQESGEITPNNLVQNVVADFRKDLERSYQLLNFTFFWKLANMIEAGGSGYEETTSGS